ncbi:unnamed protein product, partial [Rotaria sp. Silwood2]
SIPMDRLKFHEFETIIRKIDANLKVLRVKAQSQDITFLNAHRWEKLILEYLPQLEDFYLRYVENFNREYHYPGGPDQFISSSWIKRQWTFEVEIDDESINYFSMTINIIHILTVAQIYHLEISEENVHVAALIEAVSLLSELTTLKIHSLSLHESRTLNSEELLTLASMEDRSKITKVYLKMMNDIEEFYFPLELCPYMEHL